MPRFLMKKTARFRVYPGLCLISRTNFLKINTIISVESSGKVISGTG